MPHITVDCLGADSDAVLVRANAEGPFVRLPRYPTTAKITRIEES